MTIPKYRKIGMLLLGAFEENNSEKIVKLLQDHGYVICSEDKTEDGEVLSILEENIN